MADGDVTHLTKARAAYDRRGWQEALDAFRAAEADGAALAADDLERKATSACLVAEPADELLGAAFEAFELQGSVDDAVRVALDLFDYHGMLGEFARAMGWARRAVRLLESAPECVGHARLAIWEGFVAVMGGKVNEALSHVERGYEIACRQRHEECQALALSRRARLRLRLGQLEEATADADEAMLIVHRDRTRPIIGAMIYCNTIDFCRDLGDFERALEWTEAAAAWTTERQVCVFPGVCRVHRAELLRLLGNHEQAEAELRAALELFQRHRFRFGIGEAQSELGRLRLEAGDLEQAEVAFADASDAGVEPLPGAALLLLRRGDAPAARSVLQSALDERADNPLGRAQLLPAFVSACVGQGDLEAASAAVEELLRIAERIGTLGIRAQAMASAAQLHLARGQSAEAVRAGRAATRAWNMIGAGYELARARELLAQAYEATGDTLRAQMEYARVEATKGARSASVQYGATLASHDASAGPARNLSGMVPIREGVTLDSKIAIGPVLGIGGMGVVHRGKHLLTGRDVAVKILKRSVCGESPQCQRFLQEARACGRIRHPNVVDIYDAGMHGQEPYIVMELLLGRSLEEHLADAEPPPLSDALSICEQAARGVAAAHQAGVIHRDLKPANVFLCEQDDTIVAKVLDFGISKQPEGGQTQPGQLLGTPFYMAPEQVLTPNEVDERTDVYALGAVLFDLLTGRPPFVSESIPELLMEITSGSLPSLRSLAPAVPPEVEQLVMRVLARDAAQRFPSAAELAKSLASARAALAS